MGRTRTLTCWAYGVIAAAALVLTYIQYLAIPTTGALDFYLVFWALMRANHAARGITVDFAFFGLAGALFMIGEARRLKIRYVWLYILFSYAIDVSVVFPVFMILRERAMARAGEAAAGLTLSDLIALAATAGLVGWQVWYVMQ
jgi:hypothetical protein